ANSDMLVLLYTDRMKNWDWCVYESGYFQGAHRGDPKPLVVLHYEKVEPPAPLKHLQTVRLSWENGALHQWLASGLGLKPPATPASTEPPASRAEDYFAPLENQILEAVCDSQEPEVFSREIRLEVSVNSLKQGPPHQMPKDVQVFGTAASLRDLFSLKFRPEGYRWDEFYPYLDQMSGHTPEWVDALVTMMRSIAFSPATRSSTGLPLYQSLRGERPRFYRPVVRAFRKLKGKLCYKILFADLPSETTIEPNVEASQLFHALET